MPGSNLGYFGNVWIKQTVLEKIGDYAPGHKHNFDHVSLITKGKVQVEVEGNIKEFVAPTFVVIRKEYEHVFTALEDDTQFYCIFALRDFEGEVFDPIFSDEHDPLSAEVYNHPGAKKDYWKQSNKIDV